ncbi:MAG: tape measure protein [Flavihumibacter sp.]|nr:tape measure protein [Flavihumibacter sp.]
MSNTLEFILKLTDQMSAGMRTAAAVADSTAVRIQGDMNRMAASGNTFGYTLSSIQSKIHSLGRQRIVPSAVSDFEKARTAGQRFEDQLDRIARKNSGGMGSGGGSGMGAIFGGNVLANMATGAVSQITQAATQFAQDSFSASLFNTRMSNALNATTGGQGGEAMQATRDISQKYGLDYQASLEGVKTLTGGLMSMNLPLQKQMEIFEGVSTGIAAMNLDAETAKGAMLALGQMASKGTVSAEELRGQLGERIPGAFGIAAKAMGVTEAELGKMMQKGELTASEFLPKFAQAMKDNFGEAALEASKGPVAMMNRFNNSMYDLKKEVGDGLMPIIVPFVEKLTELAQTVMPYIRTGFEYVMNLISNISSGTSEWAVWIEMVRMHAINVWNYMKLVFSTTWNIVSGLVQWAAQSVLIQDIFKALVTLGGFVYDIMSNLAKLIGWIFEKIVMPVLQKFEWIYTSIKSLLGFGNSTEMKLEQTLKIAQPPGTNPNKAISPAGVPVTPDKPTTKTDVGGSAQAINSGGQRNITITIGKQIEKLELNTVNMKEGATEIANIIREELRRVLYSINGQVAT